MTAKEAIEHGLRESFTDAQGNAHQLRLKPGFSQTQIEEFEERLAVPLPKEIRDLLAFTAGFNLEPFGEVGFSTEEMFGLEEILPLGLATATDGAGNDWVIDIRRDTGEWGPVVFMSHDPPVAVIQAPNLATFIEQVLDSARPSREKLLDFVVDEAVSRIWAHDPYLLDVQAVRSSSDNSLSEFSKQLPASFRVADLRSREIGTGFTWGRGGPTSTIKRYDSELIFGVETEAKKSLLSRLLRRMS